MPRTTAERLRAQVLRLRELGVTQKAMAEHMGISESVLSRWLSEDPAKPLSTAALDGLMDYLRELQGGLLSLPEQKMSHGGAETSYDVQSLGDQPPQRPSQQPTTESSPQAGGVTDEPSVVVASYRRPKSELTPPNVNHAGEVVAFLHEIAQRATELAMHISGQQAAAAGVSEPESHRQPRTAGRSHPKKR